MKKSQGKAQPRRYPKKTDLPPLLPRSWVWCFRRYNTNAQIIGLGMKMVGTHLTIRIIFYIWPNRIQCLDKLKIDTKCDIVWTIPFLKYRISYFWPNRNPNLDTVQPNRGRRSKERYAVATSVLPGCYYIDHRLPHSYLSKRGGTKIEKGTWRL